jgi:hypothetical protein
VARRERGDIQIFSLTKIRRRIPRRIEAGGSSAS